MEIINCLCKVHEVLIIHMKTEKRKEKQTNLAKGRFIVQPRASVSMTTCSNFEIKWTVDSVREKWELIILRGRHQTHANTSTPRYMLPNYFSFASRKHRRAGFWGSRYLHIPGSVSGDFALICPNKHATVNEECSNSTLGPRPCPLHSQLPALLYRFFLNEICSLKLNLI